MLDCLSVGYLQVLSIEHMFFAIYTVNENIAPEIVGWDRFKPFTTPTYIRFLLELFHDTSIF